MWAADRLSDALYASQDGQADIPTPWKEVPSAALEWAMRTVAVAIELAQLNKLASDASPGPAGENLKAR